MTVEAEKGQPIGLTSSLELLMMVTVTTMPFLFDKLFLKGLIPFLRSRQLPSTSF
jgi:hypothetical protein